MVGVTGDTHGNQVLWDACITPSLRDGDTIIVLGDFGFGFFDGRYWPEEMFYDLLAEQKYTVLFIDGNHENFEKFNAYPVKPWNGGRVQFIRKNVIRLMRGEIYNIDGKKGFLFWWRIFLGQGKLQITPLHLSMIGQVLENKR